MKKLLTILTILLTITVYSQVNYQEYFRKEREKFTLSDTTQNKDTFTDVERYNSNQNYNNWGDNDNTEVIVYYNSIYNWNGYYRPYRYSYYYPYGHLHYDWYYGYLNYYYGPNYYYGYYPNYGYYGYYPNYGYYNYNYRSNYRPRVYTPRSNPRTYTPNTPRSTPRNNRR